MLTLTIALVTAWLVIVCLLWLTQSRLLRATWQEAYTGEALLVIESDDWGPGEPWHAERLRTLFELFSRHRDRTGRPVIFTADMVLAVPDAQAFEGRSGYARRYLDQGWPMLHQVFREGMQAGVLVPQLHGLEHCHGDAVVQASSADITLHDRLRQPDWSDWESLPSPLQGHYVDGGTLPTRPLDESAQRERVQLAVAAFRRLFGMPTLSTVAPCYLWNDATEAAWHEVGIRYIQTAGYRCTGRDRDGRYIQDPAVIRAGHRNRHQQIHLVRNCMYEPADGRDADACLRQMRAAWRERAPIVISTHRYNYTRDHALFSHSLHGLARILEGYARITPRRRHLCSPELGAWYAGEPLADALTGAAMPHIESVRGLQRFSAFLYRLWRRHAKLRLLVIASGLLLPFATIWALARLAERT